MVGQYHLDLAEISLDQFRHLLESGDLLPSEQILMQMSIQ